jgi:hypothetical protein
MNDSNNASESNYRWSSANPNKIQLRDERIAEALDLFKDAHSVEVKLTVPDTDRLSAIRALDIDVLKAELRQVVFFDTRDLRLSGGGMVVRARRIPGGGDTVVKLRPLIPADIPHKIILSSRFKIEIDVMPGVLVCSGSLKGKADNSDVRAVLVGKRPIQKLFQPEQRFLFRKQAPEGIDFDSLIPFGPINVAKAKFSHQNGAKRKALAELWFYPDGSRILELSTKCALDEAFQVAAEFRAFLMRKSIPITAGQQTKTRKAMDYFSRIHDSN